MAGDRIRFDALPFTERIRILFPIPGSRLRVPVEHLGPSGAVETRTVTMVAGTSRVAATNLERRLIVFEFLGYVKFVAVGTTLVYLRPSPTTWWLWLYCLGWWSARRSASRRTPPPPRDTARAAIASRSMTDPVG